LGASKTKISRATNRKGRSRTNARDFRNLPIGVNIKGVDVGVADQDLDFRDQWAPRPRFPGKMLHDHAVLTTGVLESAPDIPEKLLAVSDRHDLAALTSGLVMEQRYHRIVPLARGTCISAVPDGREGVVLQEPHISLVSPGPQETTRDVPEATWGPVGTAHRTSLYHHDGAEFHGGLLHDNGHFTTPLS
jgi:hypothetical protein